MNASATEEWCKMAWIPHLNQALLLTSPAQTGKPACKLSYPSFVQPGPGESAVLVYIKLVWEDWWIAV